jgi:mannose-6-phosphate isomerase
MPELYPIFFTPVFKHYMWGGHNLQLFRHEIKSSKPVAESWEIASHKDGMSVVKNGFYAGKTLPDLLAELGLDLVGHRNTWALEREKFPLMVKLLDAEQRLSIQVHPDDDYALKNEGKELGKAEMWVVLRAKPGAAIIYGFSKPTTAEAFRNAIQAGSPEPFLHTIPIQAGDHICVPPGTLHAILGGALMVEIQQNSNTTYRVYDWNRSDDQGNKRPLHVEKALDVINFQQIKSSLPKPEILEDTPNISRECLCENAYFTTERITVKQKLEYKGRCDGSTLEIWGVIAGQAQIAGASVKDVQFFLLPAGLGDFVIATEANSVLLRAYTPCL